MKIRKRSLRNSECKSFKQTVEQPLIYVAHKTDGCIF